MNKDTILGLALGVIFSTVLASLIAVLLIPNSSYKVDDPTLPKYKQTPNDPVPTYGGIIRLKDSMDQFFCSGWVVSGDYAITAAHCLTYTGKNSVIRIYDQYDNFTGVEATVVGYNERNDSGALRGDFRKFKALDTEFNKHGFMYSDGPFMTCGYPYGQKNIYCSYATKISADNFAMRLRGVLIPGMSGGPVFDLQTNKVVGLNTAVDGLDIIVNSTCGALGSTGIPE